MARGELRQPFCQRVVKRPRARAGLLLPAQPLLPEKREVFRFQRHRVIDTREKAVFDECRRCIAAGSAADSFLCAGVHGDFIVDHARAILTNQPFRTTVNVPNRGLVPGLPADAIVEVHGQVTAHGVEAFGVGELPHFQRALMVQQNAYEQLTVEAALEGSYTKALQALTLNRTVPSADVAKRLLDDLLAANRDYWPVLK